MKKRPNNDGSIGRYGDRWRGRYTDPIDGKQKAVYGTTQAECKVKLDAVLHQIKTGEYVKPEKISVEKWLLFWFENYYRISVKPSSASTTKSNIDKHLIPFLGKHELQKLRPDHVQAFIRQKQAEGISASTIKRYIKVLRQALRQAVENGKIRKDPTSSAKLPKAEKKEIPFLTAEEQAIFLSRLPSSTNGRALRFLLGTGLRVSELCGLQWKDIQQDGLHIERINMTFYDLQEEGYTNITAAPKTTAGKRIIPLPDPLRQLLEEQRKTQMQERLRAGCAWASGEPGKGDTFIFCNAIGNPADRHNLNRSFRAILTKCNLPTRGVHALRHTFATNWVQRSPDISSLARILGHTDPAFTYKTYCHADQTNMEKGMEAMMQTI